MIEQPSGNDILMRKVHSIHPWVAEFIIALANEHSKKRAIPLHALLGLVDNDAA